MPEYRRHRVPGGTYFFTLALANRRSDLLVREIATLRAAVARTRRLYRFQIDAWVVQPEHMHAVWTLPDGDAGYSLRNDLIGCSGDGGVRKSTPPYAGRNNVS